VEECSLSINGLHQDLVTSQMGKHLTSSGQMTTEFKMLDQASSITTELISTQLSLTETTKN
jgi:hypothetical protein